jgi:hypothetical protein
MHVNRALSALYSCCMAMRRGSRPPSLVSGWGLFVLGAVCLPSVAAATPPGVALRWNSCFGDGGANNRTFVCASNTGVNTMVGSFSLPTAMNGVTGIETEIAIFSSDAALPAWWQLYSSGSCRQTSLTQNTIVSPVAISCLDWAEGAALGGIGGYQAQDRHCGFVLDPNAPVR